MTTTQNTTAAITGYVDTDKLSKVLAAATPGPWEIEKNGHWHYGMITVNGPRVRCVGFLIATDVSEEQAVTTKADAALIALAPNLAVDVIRLTATLAERDRVIADLTAANTLLVTWEAEARRLLDRGLWLSDDAPAARAWLNGNPTP